ncbi:CHAT domain-containing protein [Aerosakkonemataceae cyanobacterium BLCC-F50]|uniref:CHAT domain-containing protein n=1 Tax=Floridaenema flaviceps BLCC-F50 TaxID=3153642 RepID=A0ABV4XMI0_9CYAN
MARKRYLFLYQLLTVLKMESLKIRLIIIQQKLQCQKLDFWSNIERLKPPFFLKTGFFRLSAKLVKRWLVYGSIACLSTLLCVVGMPAKAIVPNITATQSDSIPLSALPETGEQIPPLERRVRGDLTQAESLEQQAKNLYEAGRYSEASQLLQQALQSYEKKGDTIGQAIVLSNLALGYQQLGKWQEANGAIDRAFTLLKIAPPDTPSRSAVWAQALDVQGSLQLAQGKAEQANDSWLQSAKLYTQLHDSNRATQSRINQAQALQALGLYSQVGLILKDLRENLQSQQPNTPSLIKAENLRILGDALRVTGNLDCSKEQTQQNPKCLGAREVLQESLSIATQLRSPQAIAAANLSLGNLAWTQSQVAREQGNNQAAQYEKEALNFYQQAMAMSIPAIQTQAQLNQLRLLVELGQWQEAQALYPQVQQQIDNLPPGRSKIYAQVNLALSLKKLSTRNQDKGTLTTPSASEINQVLTSALRSAESLGDVRSQAQVLQELGQLYEKTQQWSFAQDLAQKSLSLSESINASEISYRAAWELGRILKAQGKIEEAIAAYTEAYQTLKSVRGDLIAASPDVQFSFRGSVEPVYRELVDLLLQPSPIEAVSALGRQGAQKQNGTEVRQIRRQGDKEKEELTAFSSSESPAPKQEKLKKAREVLEALQVAQLQNYFQQACEDVKLELDRVVEQKGQTAAVIYPIILEDRLEIILKLPREPNLQQYTPVRLDRKQIEKKLKGFQNNLRDEYKFKAVQESGKEVYDWLIQPFRDRLDSSGVKTLIFILDGALRTIPMSALYDGKEFLVKNYAVVLVLGLEVRDPTPLNRSNMKVLAAGLSKPPKEFEDSYGELPNVKKELDRIKEAGVYVMPILDGRFTTTEFNKDLNQDSFQVVHLATHGQFGAEPNSTYILTADKSINLNELDQMFRTLQGSKGKAIDLLIFSACKTAAGNDRAVLGIAGTVVRAGAQSAIAGLWSLADEPSPKFAETLYQNLGKDGISRAEALRQAQLALLQDQRYQHPRYWAPYVLVGSWL